MEHEVLVPLSPQTARRSLRRPELLSRCLPGFTPDDSGAAEPVPAPDEHRADPAGSDTGDAGEAADSEDSEDSEDGEDSADAGSPVLAGRMKLRIGNSSITYRGTLRLHPGTDLLVDVAAQQSVGSGELSGAVLVGVEPAVGEDGAEDPDSCRIVFDCGVRGLGRIAELDPETVTLAARRLLDRFCATLVAELGDEGADGEDPDRPADQDLFEELDNLPDLSELGDFSGLTDLSEIGDLAGLSEISDLDAPDLFLIEESVAAHGVPGLDQPWPDEPAHRRSIVGRSAEEVDHAPPRGRYGPALPPRSARSRAAARWGYPERRMGEPPTADGEHSVVPWLVGGGVAVVGGVVLLARALRRR
ncbi:hypothetical protein [Streptacidiphilus albus]|uniref:hypothetical protein n=1 Tax=Streptacidiphilus albus TaxID=105425 RepID=UPI00054B2604|nr:hypothetical protein [Streptacidiphilus albus]